MKSVFFSHAHEPNALTRHKRLPPIQTEYEIHIFGNVQTFVAPTRAARNKIKYWMTVCCVCVTVC